VEFDNVEKHLIDSQPFQRLRDVHQLAMCYQIYPGATHRRFEHSLGVMEVAGRIFDRVFAPTVLAEDVRDHLGDHLREDAKIYWRRVTRIAALLHDVGHLPFSHAAEDLLAPGWDHERLTAELIRHSEIGQILGRERPPIVPEDVVDLCWSPKSRRKVEAGAIDGLSPFKLILNELITGNTFGADRIDYLLRDSHHAGVAYGRFDPDRLIHGLRLIVAPEDEELALALDIGGIHAAEALLLARYFMYSQVYFHDVRRAYDIHLRDFLKGWLGTRFKDGLFPTDWQQHQRLSDSHVQVAMQEAAFTAGHPLHELARRLLCRCHYRTVYTLVAQHKEANPNILNDVRDFLIGEYGDEAVRMHQYGPKSEVNDFRVVTRDRMSTTSYAVSEVIKNVPAFDIGFVFVEARIASQAERRVRTYLRGSLGEPGGGN